MSNAHVSRIEQRRRGGDRSIILGTNTVAEFDHTRQCHPPLIELSAEPLPKSCILENCIDGQFSFDGQANDHNFCSIAMVARVNSEFQTVYRTQVSLGSGLWVPVSLCL